MSTERDDTSQTRPGAPTAPPPPSSYERPAIVWEEPLEPTMAASSCLLVAFGDCDPRPHGP